MVDDKYMYDLKKNIYTQEPGCYMYARKKKFDPVASTKKGCVICTKLLAVYSLWN